MKKIVITGAGGTVGQNLVDFLVGKYSIVAIGKNKEKIDYIKKRHPGVECIVADVSEHGKWEKNLKGAECLISLQAQISAKNEEPFIKNNVVAARVVCEACKKMNVPYIIHASSSVVISIADDYYTRTKRESEKIVKKSGLNYVILRPTLMFGKYDTKHLGYLSKFLEKVPFYPLPGDGKYIRQPLYVIDLCKVIERCIEVKPKNKIYNIIGKEKIYYKDIIKKIRDIKGLKTPIVPIPVGLFKFLIWFYGLFSRNPPFTVEQLDALTNNDIFPLNPWWKTFNVKPTPLDKALKETFSNKLFD